MFTRRRALGTLAILAAPAAHAQANWPDRPLRIVVPFAAGGNADLIARILQPRLTELLGQPLVVENRPGAGGAIGAGEVARARADGHTLLIGSNGPLSVNPAVQARLPYDAERDFAPIAMAMQVPHCLMVQQASPHRSLADVVAASRAQPDALGAGTAGVASATHLSLEAFKLASGARILHVPYRGGGAALPDFVAGTIPLLFTEFSTALPLHRDAKGRILAVASAARLRAVPDIPTMIEQGVAGFTAASYVGLLATTGTPPEALRRLGEAMTAIVAEADFQRRMEAMGGEAASGPLATPEGFAAFIRDDLRRSREVVRAANITAQ